MFSGIIQAITKIEKTATKDGSLFLTFTRPKKWKIKHGDSIATNGVCLTVQKLTAQNYTAELMPETLERTTFGREIPQLVNVEPSLSLATLMDGHLVQGHVDTIGTIAAIENKGRSRVFKVVFPKKYAHLVAEKGSIAIDGISLTIVAVGDVYYTVSLVDYTLAHTTLGMKKKGDLVNLEFDVFAKYIARMLKK